MTQHHKRGRGTMSSPPRRARTALAPALVPVLLAITAGSTIAITQVSGRDTPAAVGGNAAPAAAPAELPRSSRPEIPPPSTEASVSAESAEPAATSVAPDEVAPPPSTTAASSTQPAQAAGGYTGPTAAELNGWGTPVPALSDEFNGTSIDGSKWGVWGDGSHADGRADCISSPQGPNLRCASNASVSNGVLTIKGEPDGTTSGLNSTAATDSGHYRVEMRRKASSTGPGGESFNAVTLVFPTDGGSSGVNGEVDYAEGSPGEHPHLYAHYGDDQHTQHTCEAPVDTTEFHDYAIDVTSGSITWYVDGQRVCQVPNNSSESPVSIGAGQMDNASGSTNLQPAEFVVDWVRTYQP